MMKKIKGPGDNISLKTRKNENAFVMAWINAQSNLMDSLRYLVEREIAANGVRNLQTCVPVERRGLSDVETGAAQSLINGQSWREISSAQALSGDGEGAAQQKSFSVAPSPGAAVPQRELDEKAAGEAAIMRYLALSGASEETIQAAFIAARQLAAAAESAAAPAALESDGDDRVDQEDVDAWS